MNESKTSRFDFGSTRSACGRFGCRRLGQSALANPGVWALCSFVVVAYLIDLSGNPLRVEAKGSASFVIHLAAAVLFGGFWGGFVAAASTVASEWTSRRPGVKIVFNTAQRFALSRTRCLSLPGTWRWPPSGVSRAECRSSVCRCSERSRTVLSYLAATYFAVNTVAVNAAVALSSGRRFGEVWNLNARASWVRSWRQRYRSCRGVSL